jgi:FkbM family methyltransferase
MIDAFRNSHALRWPLLALSRLLLSPLKQNAPALLRRAAYDAMPAPYLVVDGEELFVVSTRDRVIGRELFLHGQFDFHKLECALKIIEREGHQLPRHLIDVGANIGSIVIPALKRGLMDSATAIEPHPGNLRLLHANLALNELSDLVDVRGIAVGNTSSTFLRLQESDTNSGNHSIANDGIPVPATRLDDLGIPPEGSMLWMDIEGYEGHALQGSTSLIRAGSPIVSEFNPTYLRNSDGLDIFCDLLAERKIFDLSSTENKQTSLTKLIELHPSSFTDILAL